MRICDKSANETTLHPSHRPLTRSIGLHRTASFKGLKMTSVKPFKQENQRSKLYKKTRNEKHLRTTSTNVNH